MTRQGDAAVGMMDTAYFVGRGELLDFFNELLGTRLSKIEQTASGAIACQLTEYIFPGSIPMSRVNWEAKSDYEFVSNYKLLQAAFTKNKVQRHVDVDKLIRAKYQDNLEFCQWLKAFFDQSGAYREDYDPLAVRARGKGGKKYNELLDKTAKQHGSKPLPAARGGVAARRTTASPAKPTTTARPRVNTSLTATNTRPTTTSRPTTQSKPLKVAKNNAINNNGQSKQISTEAAVADATLMKKNAELGSKVQELETSVIELEKERDFYFNKLRNIEFMLQILQDKGWEDHDRERVVDKVFQVLYATAEEDVGISEDGEIVPTNQTAEADYSAYSAMEESLDQEVPHEGEDENLLTEVQPEPTEY